jgi:hypothetical protein
MRKRIGRNGNKDSRNRRRRGHEPRWKHWLIYGPIVVLLVAGSLAYYVIDLYQHPSLWNGIVFAVAIVFGMVVVLWPQRKSRR